MKKIINIILAILSSFFVLLYLNNNTYWLILLLIIPIYYLYNYNENIKLTKIENKYVIIFSIIYSLIEILGITMFKNIANSDINNISNILSINKLIGFIGCLILIYNISKIVLVKLINKVNIYKDNKINKRFLIFVFITIFLSCLIYLLAFYPGIITNDSVDQLGFVINNFKYGLSDHHPVLYTLFMYIFYHLGLLIHNNPNFGVATIVFFQIIIVSLTFTYLIKYLASKKVSKKILIVITLVYALYPIFPYYSVTLWKDVLFGCVFIIFNISVMELNNSKKSLIKFIIISIILLFTRNNALYIYVFLLPIYLYYFKNNKIKILLTMGLIIGSYYIIKGPIFKELNITKSSSSEYIAIPLQQINRTVFKEGNISKKEEKIINELVPIEIIKSRYYFECVDGIKFNNEFNIQIFNENKIKYFKIWLALLPKNIPLYLESYIGSTFGYLYPEYNGYVFAVGISNNNYGIHSENIINNTFFKKITSNDFIIPYSSGIIIIIMISSIILSLIKKKSLLPYMPSIGLLVTLLLSAPMSGCFRYIFGIVCFTPIIILLPFLKEKNN